MIGDPHLETAWVAVTGARTPGGTTAALFITGSENIVTERSVEIIAIKMKQIRTNIRRLVDMNMNKSTDCSQRVITDFFNPGTPRRWMRESPPQLLMKTYSILTSK